MHGPCPGPATPWGLPVAADSPQGIDWTLPYWPKKSTMVVEAGAKGAWKFDANAGNRQREPQATALL